MARNNNGNPTKANDANARLVTSAEDKAKAAKWFERARELGDKRQFDYAIEYYVNGLEYWPDAVENACKPLHGCGVARRQFGGKKPGLKNTMRRSMNDKDAKRALLNALWLFGHDPDNMSYIEGVARNASRLRAEDAAMWATGVLLKAFESTSKVNSKLFQAVARLLEDAGDRAAGRNEAPFAVNAYQMGVDALNLWRRRIPKDNSVEYAVKNLSTKLCILKGKYEQGESYRDSIVDSDEQVDLHDQKRSVQSDERLDALIGKADAEFKQNTDSPETLKKLVDLLCRRERDDDEARAIGILLSQFKSTGSYRWKHLADDIRMKQLGRKRRVLIKKGDQAASKEQYIAQLRFELGVFKERTERYPTDNRVRFDYGVRNFQAGRFDEAIPLFQSARADPKNRATCGMYLGRCFFRKGYHAQAIAALQETLDEYEFHDDNLGKSMIYWLGRAQEASGDIQNARNTYGKILQLDYNYSDIRARLDKLSPPA